MSKARSQAQEEMMRALPAHLYTYLDDVSSYFNQFREELKPFSDLHKEMYLAKDDVITQSKIVLHSIDELNFHIRRMFRTVNKLKANDGD